MGISVDGLTNLLSGSGAGVGQLAVNRDNPVQNLDGYGTNYASAFDRTNYLNNAHDHRLEGLETIHAQVREHLMEDARQSTFVDARENEATLS